jgi:Bacterial Ig-like domain
MRSISKRLGAALVVCAAIWATHPLWRYTTNAAQSSGTTVRPLFDLRSPDRSPFPSDAFTVVDANQNTGRRVNLPMPQDCVARASECEDVAVLNQLDGFNMQARISVPFDGDIDPGSVTSTTVFLVKLRNALSGRGDDHAVVGINYIVWDPATRELSFRPDNLLDQHTTYALVVTTGVRDAAGKAIASAANLGRGSIVAGASYRRALADAESIVRRTGLLARGQPIAALAVFTTQTFSHIVERMRDVMQRAPAPTLNFGVGPDGARAVFNVSQIESLTNNADIESAGGLTPQPINLNQIRAVSGSVAMIAFGTFRTLDFTTRPSGHIGPIATRTGTLLPSGSLDVAFNLWSPAGARPARGWPVAISGAHGSFGSKNSTMAHASVLASHGIAVISINGYGRGLGPRTTMTVLRMGGTSMTFAAPGLGYDQNGDGTISAWEPQRAARPHALLNISGTCLQEVAQYFALVRALQRGVDIDGDGAADLDGSRLYYFGQSLGAGTGVVTFAYEPALRSAVFTVPSGAPAYNTQSGPTNRPGFGSMLAARVPSVLNSTYGVTSIDGVVVGPPHYNDNLPLRNQPPRVNTVPGAVAIQRVIDTIVWAHQVANATAFAPLLRRARPPGMQARPFIFQWARSDQVAVNPSAAEVVRAGQFVDRVAFYRHDLNAEVIKTQPNPHAFLSGPNFQRHVGPGAQHQIGMFFASDGNKVIHPTPPELWEVPIKTPVPEDLFYLPRPK